MRGNGSGRGRGRGRGRGGAAGSGPLVTDHIEIKNLDRELQFLRRKRQVVQYEQKVLSMQYGMDRKRQLDYEQPNRNGPNMYGNDWQSSPPKRFNASQRKPWGDAGPNYPRSSNPNSREPPSMDLNNIPPLFSKKVEMPRGMVPFNQMVTPLLKPVVHPILNKTITVRKDFNPPKVMKSRPFPPNKLNSYPLQQRKNLIGKAMSKPDGRPKPLVLSDDVVPTQKMTGRLELALGSLVKELRIANADNKPFKSLVGCAGPLRLLKQAIRERIRNVMINQPVGSVPDITKRYRQKYSEEHDKELVDLVLNTKNSKPVTMVESGGPEAFFKANITPIMEKKLEEMFSNLLKMYSSNRCKTYLSYTKAVAKIDKPNQKDTTVEDEKARSENVQKLLRSLTGKMITVEEQDALNSYYTEQIENILDEKIPQALPNYIKYCTQIFDLDEEYRSVKIMALKRLKEDHKKAAAQAKKAENQLTAEGQTNNEAGNEMEEDESNVKDEEGNAENIDKEVTESNGSQGEETNEDDEVLDTMEPQEEENNEINNETSNTESQDKENDDINNKVSNTKTQEESIKKVDTETLDKKVLQEDTSTKHISAEVTTSVNKKAVEVTSDKKDVNVPATPTPTKTTPSSARGSPMTPSTPSGQELPYYVKLIGRPTLPSRAVICEFLNKYRPKSIKKHKSCNNLLVVGFIDRDDYNSILTANETVLGDITIAIKASEPVNRNNDSQKEVKENKKDEVKETAKKTGNGLDGKINDSVTPIKKSDAEIESVASQNGDENKSAAASKESNSDNNETRQIESIKEVDEKEGDESDKADKGPKGNVKESGRSTPVRSSSRLANVTPSTIRTRRASRLIQE